MSLRFRLNLMITLAMLAIIGLGTWFVLHNARRSVADEVRASLALALQLIDLQPLDSTGRASSVDWLGQLARLDRTRHLRIEVRRAEAAALELPRALPLPQQAAVPAWFRWAVMPPPLWVEKPVRGAGGEMLTLTLQADPGDEIAEAWHEARDFLWLMLVLAGTVFLLVHVTVGRGFHAIATVLKGLEDIEHGAYDMRLPGFSLPEFTRIAEAFNHMASALETARNANRALTRQSLAIQEEERRAIAQELHDELGQSLSAVKVLAASLRRPSVPRDRPASEEAQRPDGPPQAADAIMAICDHLFTVVRSLMRRLRPAMLDELGLAAALEDMIEHWRTRCPHICWEFHCDDRVEECIGAGKIHVFRIVQEGLTNAVRHAEAARIALRLQLVEHAGPDGATIRLQICDDGKGFDAALHPAVGFGLSGIQERVASLGGRFSLQSGPAAGVVLEIDIPCDKIAP